MLTQKKNIQIISQLIKELTTTNNHTKYILIDGDRTLSPIDVTHPFFQNSHLHRDDLEACFELTHYSFEMFFKAAQLYSTITKDDYLHYCQQTAKEVDLYPQFIEFIKQAAQHAQIIVITAGIRVLWGQILENYDLQGHVFLMGGNHFAFDDYIIDQEAKGVVIDQLHLHGKHTIAMGDSLVDYDMLTKAKQGYVVVDDRRNKRLIERVVNHPSISQISFTDFEHEQLNRETLPEILAQHVS